MPETLIWLPKNANTCFFPISGNCLVTSQNHKNKLQKNVVAEFIHEIQVGKFKNLVKTSKKNFSSRNVHNSNERVLTESIVIALWIKLEKLLLDGLLFKIYGSARRRRQKHFQNIHKPYFFNLQYLDKTNHPLVFFWVREKTYFPKTFWYFSPNLQKRDFNKTA